MKLNGEILYKYGELNSLLNQASNMQETLYAVGAMVYEMGDERDQDMLEWLEVYGKDMTALCEIIVEEMVRLRGGLFE